MAPSFFSQCRHENCDNRAISFSEFCWEHTGKKAHLSKLGEAIRAFDPLSGPLNLSKVECEDVDFSGLDLKGSSFSQATIGRAQFIGTNLSNCDMIGARFTGCDFVGSEAAHANFTKAIFTQCSFSHADFRGANFTEARFKDADFMGAVLCNAVLWNADLSGAKYLKKRNFNDPETGPSHPKTHLSEENPLIAFESYRSLKHHFYEKGFYEDASWAAYRGLTMERKHLFKAKNLNYISSLLMDLLSGYTEKPDRVVLSALGMIIFFGVVYFFMDAVRPTADLALGRTGFWDCIYFSFMTFTTVGFGDFIPRAGFWIKALVGVEAFSGPFMAGLFIFTLTRRYAAG